MASLGSIIGKIQERFQNIDNQIEPVDERDQKIIALQAQLDAIQSKRDSNLAQMKSWEKYIEKVYCVRSTISVYNK